MAVAMAALFVVALTTRRPKTPVLPPCLGEK
jgi:hypothetical protein